MSLINITLSGGAGIPAVGSVLFIANQGSPQTFRPIGNAGNQKWDMKVKTADTTNQGTRWTQSIPTLFEGGTFTCDLHYIPGSTGADSSGAFGHDFTTGLGSVFVNGIISEFKLVYPNGVIAYFSGFIMDFPQDMNIDKDILANLKIQVTGQPILV